MDPSSGMYSQPPYLESHLPITDVNASKYPFSNLPQNMLQPPHTFPKPMMQVNNAFTQQQYPLNSFYPWKVQTPQNLPKRGPNINDHALSSRQILTHLSDDITLKSIQNTLSLLLQSRFPKDNFKKFEPNGLTVKACDLSLNETSKISLEKIDENFQAPNAKETSKTPPLMQKFHHTLRKQEFNEIFFFCRNNHVFPSSQYKLQSPETRQRYCDQLCSHLASTIPLPFSLKWPGVSQNEHNRWLLGSAFTRRLKKSRLARNTGYLSHDQPNHYFFTEIEEEKKACEIFNTLSTQLNEQSSFTTKTFDWIATCYTHLDFMKKALNSASYSSIHSSGKFNKEDPCLIPSFLYLPQDDWDAQKPSSNAQPLLFEPNDNDSQRSNKPMDAVSCNSFTNDTSKKSLTGSNSANCINTFNYYSDDFEDFFPLSKASTVQETPWDIEEMTLGALWDEAVLESFIKNTPESTHNTPSIFWGEYHTVNGYLATQRYNQLDNPSTWQPEEKVEMTESFELLDRAASNEIHLQRCLLHSLSAYQIENSMEKALAFASFIMDINDKEMFFSKTSTRAPEMLLQTPTFYKNKLNLSNSDTDDAIDSSSDQETASVSSGLLSDIVDEDYGFTLNGVSGINLGNSGREFFSTDRKIPDKKLQLKKRSQEKERRIRLALLGLAPHVARNIDDTPNKSKQIDKTLNATNSPTISQQAKPNNAIKDYRDLRRRYRSLFMINRLQMTLNYNPTAQDPYSIQSPKSIEEHDTLELKNSRSAYLFLGVSAQLFPTYAMRFHRPDFRTSLPEIMRNVFNNLSESEKGFWPNFKSPPTSRLVLNLGRNGRGESDKNPLFSKTGVTVGESYTVKGLAVSNVLRRSKYRNSNNDLEGLNSLNDSGSMSQVTNSRRFSTAHPADLIEKAEDLTITDTVSIALLEYSEQSPPLLHNLGMALQITKFYRPISENMTLQQAQKKVRDRLGRFGPLKLADSYIPFFSSQMKLAKNQGVVVGESRLFKAPLFPHPTNPHSPLKIDETRATASKYGTGRFHDFRATDFLLIRKKIALESGQWSLTFSLRPIFLEPINDCSSNDNGKSDYGNLAACTLYTVGQTQPLIEVPSPRSKKCFEIRRDWLRIYALRLARQGITDFHTVKSRCLAKFGDIFEPSVLQKHLLSCRDNVSLTTPSSYSSQGLLGVNIRVVSEDALRSICSPEIICGLESSLIADYHLSEAGVMTLRSPDRISSSVQELEADETFSREQLSRAKKLLHSHTERYRQLMQTLNANDTLRQSWEQEEKTVNQNIFSFCDMVCGKRCSPIARLIEEMLLLTPWNITHNYIDIVSRHGAQLALDGIGDPSGGRGEGISLIRANSSISGVHVDGGPSEKSNDTPKEDLRKLSMRELHDRLVKFGFESDIVKSLPRWDQVALVRTFQYDNMNSYGQEKTQRKLGRLSNEQYIKRINEIFMNQRLALAPDEPQLTLSDSDSLEKADDFSNNEHQPVTNLEQETTVKPNVQTKEEETVASVKHITEKVEPVETNLEDELLSGLQSRDDQNESDHSTNSQNMELTERKALEDFRESLSKARQTNETDISSCLVEKFTPRELQFLQAKPVPRLVWIRKKKDSTTDQVKSEKIVHIYGYENIQLFYEWRRKQEAEKKYYNKHVLSSNQSVLGTASRTCRRCGQIGHISSNPICSLYTGRRKPRGSQHTSTYTGGSNSKVAYRGVSGFVSSDEDQAYDNESVSSKHTLGKSLSTKRSRLISSAYADVDSSEPNYKVFKQTQGHDSDSQFAKGKDTEDGKIMSSGPKLPTRTTARQRLILENKGALAGIAVQTYQGTYENAVNEINQIFQRVISKTDRDKRKWAVFREKISETDAPGYNTVITNPIWLNKMIKKCKAREYRSTATFLSDVQLLVDNCFRYNPPGHWIRPLVQSLGDFLREETESQGPWLVELDRFIQQYCQENVDAN